MKRDGKYHKLVNNIVSFHFQTFITNPLFSATFSKLNVSFPSVIVHCYTEGVVIVIVVVVIIVIVIIIIVVVIVVAVDRVDGTDSTHNNVGCDSNECKKVKNSSLSTPAL